MVKVGLIGFGLAGQAFHAPVIRGVEGMELACVLERHTNKSRERYPEVRVARNMDEMLSDKTIELIVVATPNDSHYSYTKTALLAGRHVVVDKPLTPTLREAEELVKLAAEKKRLITVYQDRRFDGEFATVKEMVKNGTLGEILEFESRFDRFRLDPKPGAWREVADFPAAGVLWDLGPHVLDQALVLFGEPETITASAFCQRKTATVDDSFDVAMVYPRTRALLRAHIVAYAPGPHFMIHGTKGTFEKRGMDPQEEILRSDKYPDGKDWGPNWGIEPEANSGLLSLVGEQPRRVKSARGDYRNFYANVRDAIEKGVELEVTPQQALRTMRALCLAHKSSREKRTVRWDEPVD